MQTAITVFLDYNEALARIKYLLSINYFKMEERAMVIGACWVGCPWIYSGNEEQRYDSMSFPANKAVFHKDR